jgi:PAS domain S-box-containing protein
VSVSRPPLRALVVEDSPADAELVVLELRLAFEVTATRVDREADFMNALSADLDVILADYHVPGLDARRALRLLHERGLDVPLIVVSGTIGEESAVALMREGAADYLAKDRLARLAQAVTRAMETRRLRARDARSAEALRSSEERFRRLTENAPDIIYRYRLTEPPGFEYVSPALTKLTGYTPEDLYADPALILRAVMPGNKPAIESALRGAEPPTWQRMVQWTRKDGSILWTSHRDVFVRDQAGRPIAIEGIARDVTEIVEADRALRASEEKYRKLFERIAEGLLQTTPSGGIITANPALVRMLGYDSEAELQQVRMPDLYADAATRRAFVHLMEINGGVRDFEIPLKRRNGGTILTLVNAQCVRGADGQVEHFEGTLADVTERRQLEEQFRQAQKMEAIGQLAGGVAHDFNNLLTAILGYAELLKEDFEPTDRRLEDLTEIRAAAERAGGLTRQLLAFSRKQLLQPRVLSVNEIVTNMMRMLTRIIGEDISLEWRPCERLPLIVADAGQLEQVVLNLSVNARDAMPDGGRLVIETGVEPGTAADRPLVRLTISDSGVGMTDEIQRHIFEPFFTTKEHRGTGLGLSTVYGIIHQSGGTIDVKSAPRAGSTFTVRFPSAPADAIDDGAGAARAARGGTETILLIEDEDAVRTLVTTQLQRRGYHVLAAPTPGAALDIARDHRGPIALALSDVVMPGMSGPDVLARISLSRPEIKVLYMSGYTDEAAVLGRITAGELPFIAKPFSAEALAARVREVLDLPAPRHRPKAPTVT